MDDLETVYELAFATTSAYQAFGLAIFLSLFMNKLEDVWRYAGAALAVDRFLPCVYVVLQGGGLGDAGGEFARLITHLTSEWDAMTIRYVCLMLTCSGGFYARAYLHQRFA